MIHGKKELEPEKNLILGLFKRFFHTTPSYHKEKFFVLHRGIWVATPLFITLLLIESSDIIFAMDSIPAVIAITTDPFIVFTSNVSAIMGLRALFFVVEGMVETFRFLKVGISAILCFVGTKMIISDFYQINTAYSLGFVMLVLATSILASIIRRRGV